MKLVNRSGEWWIAGIPGCKDCGPYSARADAASDMRGLRRFLKYKDDPEFVLGKDGARQWREGKCLKKTEPQKKLRKTKDV